MQYIARMKMNQFLIDKVIDTSNIATINIQPHILESNELIFMNLAIQDGIFGMSNESIVLTAKGRAYLEYIIKTKNKSTKVGLKSR